MFSRPCINQAFRRLEEPVQKQIDEEPPQEETERANLKDEGMFMMEMSHESRIEACGTSSKRSNEML